MMQEPVTQNASLLWLERVNLDCIGMVGFSRNICIPQPKLSKVMALLEISQKFAEKSYLTALIYVSISVSFMTI